MSVGHQSFGSYRSISLNHHKLTYGNYGGRKRDLLKDVPLTPTPMMNTKGFSVGNTNQFSVGDMTDEE